MARAYTGSGSSASWTRKFQKRKTIKGRTLDDSVSVRSPGSNNTTQGMTKDNAIVVSTVRSITTISTRNWGNQDTTMDISDDPTNTFPGKALP